MEVHPHAICTEKEFCLELYEVKNLRNQKIA